ncbi:uncharacterized protein LOC108110005 [Drosophila eugracilis]|uniref:uncharacterized protein LOC108110005 n=1 Tax=Drosophila eugracilis TaxID=29029 RepID=UPI0007E7BBDC|nr:uncharacterized protein LOC108110005 [Drosophila eugracilis]
MTTAARPLDVSRSRSSGGSGNKTANTTTSTEPQPQPQPSVDRRRLNRIWLLVILAFTMSQLTSGGGGCGVSAAPITESNATNSSSNSSSSSSSNPLKHLQKRSQAVNFRMYFQQKLNASSVHRDWENTCGHKPTGLNETHNKAKRCKKRQMILQKLQSQTGRELKSVQGEDKARTTTNSDHMAGVRIKALDISNKHKWVLHKVNYKFLPRLNISSQQLNLRHVHRDLQIYVGAFTYLRNVNLHWDLANLQAKSVLSDELDRMRKSARDMLCSVEEAINLTNLLYAPNRQRAQKQLGQKKRRQAQPVVTYKILPRHLMEKRLQQFKSPLVQLHQQATLAARGEDVPPPQDTNDLEKDALFAKLKFVQYMKSVRKILSSQRKNLCKVRTLKMDQKQKLSQN